MEPILPFAGRLTGNGHPIGSGFIVHPSGLVATCWHVVDTVCTGGGVLQFALLDGRREFPVELAGAPDLRHDLVLLRPRASTRPPTLPHARLLTGDSATPGDAFVLQGFGMVDDPSHSYQFLSATGQVVGPAQRDGIHLIQAESRHILRGMSGAGLFLPDGDGIVGVLTERYIPPSGQGWLRDTAWAVPAERLAALRPDLLSAVPVRRAGRSRLGDHRTGVIWQTHGLRRAAAFAGRHAELDRLREILVPGRSATAVLTGVGGVGKTRLALEFAHRRATDYDVVWLARAEVLAADMDALAAALGLAPAADRDARTALDGWLSSHSRWLVIIDAADEPAAVRDLLPAGGGHVVITSRDAQWGNLATPVRVATLDRASAVSFFRQRGVVASDGELNLLSEAVGDLPLALEHAASFLQATGRTADDYRKLLRDRAAELLADALSPDYPRAITSTWSLSFDRLRAESPAALELLRVAAFLAADDIPLELLSAAAAELPRRFRAALSDPLTLARTVGHLGRYSLAQVTADGISVHPLVQTMMREVALGATGRDQYSRRAIRTLRREFPSDARDPDRWPVCARLAPHVLAAAGHAERLSVEPVEASWLLDRVATYLEVRVNSQTALPLYQRSVSLLEPWVDRFSAVLASRLNNLAGTLFQVDELSQAKLMFERVLAIDEHRRRRHREPIPASHLMNYGIVSYFLGERDRAIDYMERAVASADPSDESFGIMLLNLASRLRVEGERERALALVDLAERSERQRVGTRHPSYAVTLTERARIAADAGDLPTAVALHRRATEIHFEHLGPDAPTTITAYSEYFHDLTLNGAGSEALELADWMREHLDLSGPPRSTGLVQAGADHTPPRVLAALGIAYLEAGRAGDALDCFYAAAAAIEAALGPESAAMALADNNIAAALLALGRVTEARPLLERAVRAARTAADPEIAIYLANLATADARSGDTGAAARHIAEAYDAGHDSDLPVLLEKIATAQAAMGHTAAARATLERARSLLATAAIPAGGRCARLAFIARRLAELPDPPDGDVPEGSNPADPAGG